MDIIIEIIIEVFAQFFVEFLFDLFIGTIDSSTRQRYRLNSSFLSFVFVCFAGSTFGILSCYIYGPLITSKSIQHAHLLLTPLFVGYIMHLLGNRKSRKGKNLVALDRFLSAYLFALCFALWRYFLLPLVV